MRKWLLAAMLWIGAPCWAQELVMAVSEGTSGGLDHAQVIAKYQGLADVIGRSIQRKVHVVFAREFAQLDEGMKSRRFDFVLARPSDYPARAIRDHGYRFLASAKPDGQCLIIAGKDSGIRTVADLRGRRIVMPEPAAYMTKFCRAELRDHGVVLEKEGVQHVREQGAVAFYLEQRLADAGGVASYSPVARKWIAAGGTVVHRSRTQPYFPLVAGPAIGEPQRAEIRRALAALPQSPAGEAVLRSTGIEAFETGGEERLRQLLDWLGA